tara:strand:+ start:378 stop:683 length:306 start_codon:yes stop_codon:yes gene_type:complete
MKKIVFIILIISISATTNLLANEINCSQFEKISAKYLECKARNLKKQSKDLKLKVTAGTEELKKKITMNTEYSKRKFNKFALKEKLIKFKKSKTLTDFMEK